MPDIDFDSRRSWLDTVLRNPACETLVADGPRGPVGFVTIEANYLHQLVVEPEAKGTDAAALLLAAIAARSNGVVVLDVNQENPRAVRFYRREGFQIEADGINPASRRPTWRMVWRAAEQAAT